MAANIAAKEAGLFGGWRTLIGLSKGPPIRLKVKNVVTINVVVGIGEMTKQQISGSIIIGPVAARDVNQVGNAISQKIGQLQQDNNKIEMAKALDNLKSDITKEDLNGDIKAKLLEQLDRIANAANLPQEDRDGITLEAIIDKFQSTLQSLGNLAKSWEKWGPVVLAFFGFTVG